MSQRGCILLGALILLPFLIVGLIRMRKKAQRRAKYSTTVVQPGPALAAATAAAWQVRGNGSGGRV